jgi:hypothetical protein
MMSLKEGVSGVPGDGVKKEGVVPEFGISSGEAMRLDTAGLMGPEGQGVHNLSEGNHNKGGGKVDLGSDRPHPATADKFRRM